MPFFQGASNFSINGGHFEDVQGNQNNKHENHSHNIAGENNTVNISPDFSRQDNRAFSADYSNVNIQAGYGTSPQNHVGSTIPHGYVPPPVTQDQSYQMQAALARMANPHPQPAAQAGTPQQGSNNLNLPQIMNQQYDSSGDIANILNPHPHPQQVPRNSQNSLSMPQNLLSSVTSWPGTPGSQHPLEYDSPSHLAFYPHQPPHQIPSHIPGLAAPTEPSGFPGSPAGQDLRPPRSGARVAYQSRPQQHWPPGASIPPPQPLSSASPPNHAAQTPPSQHPPLPSSPVQLASVVPPLVDTSSGVSHGPPLASSAPESSHPLSDINEDGDGLVDLMSAQPAVPAIPDTSDASASAIVAPTNPTSSTATIPNVATIPPTSPSQVESPTVAYENPTNRPAPASTSLFHNTTASPVVSNPPLPSNSLTEAPTSFPAPISQPLGSALPAVPQNKLAGGGGKWRNPLLAMLSFGKKKQKVGQAAAPH
ncbi:hypothetical protein P691DRAFT_252889 [Macrolepiota fuliginosa MF-IS2]|uniref:Uncharacterized protein n=1 Tax=Macrolepiota fuliginosa MF-IS2 TaxID=1400762 RepID=A0A9P5X8Q8_9AGAR|nr:hypothetical protein P691DRAFT_252889 [Macrolepiota fuliginosa MF-IS2]